MRPEYLIQGDQVRLIPIGADSNKEARVLSVCLSMMTQIPALSKNLLASCNYRFGARAELRAWTEVTLGSKESKDRPDALLQIVNGKKVWTALIEAKIGKAQLSDDQVSRYVGIAKEYGIDAVITVSNQMVARSDHHPVSLPKTQLRKVELFHWPWAWILSEAEILRANDSVEDSEQAFMLNEFIRFLDHPSTGIEGFTQMNKGWKSVVKEAVSQTKLKRTDKDVEETVGAWLQEQRDLAILMSKHIGKNVRLKMDRKVKDDPVARLKHRIADFCDTNCLFTILQIPDAASDLLIQANLVSRSISVSMKLKAPMDKKSTSARVNWLLRMLKATDQDSRVIVKASWPSIIDDTQRSLSELLEDPNIIQCDNPKHAPVAFEVMLLQDSAARFSGSRTFIEDVEEATRVFYDLVGQHLKAWQPSPPKPVTRQKSTEIEPELEATEEEIAEG